MTLPRKSVIAAVTMGVVVTLGALRAGDLYFRRAEVVRVAEARAGNLASILAEYLRDTFSAGDASLRQLALRSQRIGGPAAPDADWMPSLVSGRAGLTGAGSISVTDAEGIVRHSTATSIVGQSRRNQFLFRRLSSDPADAFVVDQPYLALTEPKQYIIPVGRRLTRADGTFDGVIAITFTPAALRTFFRTIDVGNAGAVSVLHPDGFVLVREPSDANPIGESSRANPIFTAAQRSHAGVVEAPLSPGGAMMVSAFRVTDTPPLIVAVSLDRGELLADWRRQVLGSAIFFLVLGGTMAATLAVLFRQMDAKAAVEQRLAQAQEAESRQLKAANDRLAKALEIEQAAHREAETAARLKDEFVMTVSHELRTPLTAIAGWAQILELGKLNPQQAAAAVETIARSARMQTRLVDDLLDVSRLISGKLRLELREVNVADVIAEAVAVVRPAAAAKTIIIDAAIDPLAGPIVADPDRVQQVVWNLLSNAIKFTPAGGRVEVSLHRTETIAEIVVRDTGSGIPGEFLPHVFERFRQGDAGTQRRHGGLGLGLAIVRHLVELHGGTVTAASAGEGQGSTFRVSLPTRRADGLAAAPAVGPHSQTALS
jgi:signal transduction histidine kinase